MQACRWTIVDAEGIVGDAGEARCTMMILFRNKRAFPFVDDGLGRSTATHTRYGATVTSTVPVSAASTLTRLTLLSFPGCG